jgi:putative tryptophan/tyrosine transport system substrate-binding protein
MHGEAIKRRTFISLLGGAAAAWPLAARAQQNDRARWIGILMAFTESDAELRKLGWAEGSNLRIEERWPADNMDRVRSDAAELVELKPDAILVEGPRTSVARADEGAVANMIYGSSCCRSRTAMSGWRSRSNRGSE